MEQMRRLTLRKYQGQPVQLTAQARLANEADLADFVALQDRVRQAMPDPNLYIPSAPEELCDDLQHSLCVGIWVENAEIAAVGGVELPSEIAQSTGQTLVAYMTMRYYGADAHNYAHYFDLPAEEVPFWANMDSVVVLSDFRGNRLQQILCELVIEWRRPDIIGVGCTISPDNAHSLANAKALGCEIHTRRVMYGAHDRYLLRKRLLPLPGKYRHFKGNDYRVLSTATHSETCEPMVVYQALYGERGIWVRPAELWFEFVSRDGYNGPRFVYCGE